MGAKVLDSERFERSARVCDYSKGKEKGEKEKRCPCSFLS